jgi:hypothetical protein
LKKYSLLTSFVLILTIVVVLISAHPALAVPPMPSSFYGTVKLNGANVPAGTSVTARINGVTYVTSPYQVYNGDTVYSLDVPGEDSDTPGIQGGVDGDTVVFFIGSVQAAQTGAWHSGTNEPLNLSDHPNFNLFLPLVRR